MDEREELIALRRLAELEAKAAGQPASKPAKPFGQQLNDAISDIPRQVGLTARYGIEGVGGVADMVASPFRVALNAVSVPAKAGFGNTLADMAGLPKPQTETERVVGEGARLMAGAAAPIGIASRVAQGSTGTTNAIANLLSANKGQQLVSAGAAGTAGEYTKETGGNAGSQLVASLAAGVAAPMAINKVAQAGNAITRLRPATPAQTAQTAQTAQQIDIQINNALQPSGMVITDLPANIRQSIRNDVQQALLRTNGTLSPDAVRRLADYRLTGATPTVGSLTLDPATVTQQKNLSKLGINSRDPAAQQLGRTENENNATLIQNLNSLGANTTDTPIQGGRIVMGALERRNALAQALINSRYQAARETGGRSANLDPSHFTNRANDLLDDALLGGKLPADVRNLLNRTATGEMPLTVDVAEQLKTRIGDLQRASSDAAERRALGLVRSALDDTPLQPGQQIGQESIDAFNRARRLNRALMGIVERTPALQAVRDGMEPDKFVQQFIVGNGSTANVADLAALARAVRGNQQAVHAIRQQITASLKSRALNGSADEVGNFSQSAYNKALSQIGDEKLALFFTPEQINQMRAIGRVASYEQFQPRGSAVNNSNTAGTAMANVLDRIAGSSLLSKIPFGNALQEPVQNISVGIKSRRAINPINALVGPAAVQSRRPAGLLVSPAAFVQSEQE